MPLTQPGGIAEEMWELESDLPSLANQAAIELDNQILGRGKGFEAVKRLVCRLTSDGVIEVSEAYPMAEYDPITLGAVSRAIDDLIPNIQERPKQLSQAIKIAAERTKVLTQVSNDVTLVNNDELKQLRKYCLALSESASQTEWPPDENDPRHRFRR